MIALTLKLPLNLKFTDEEFEQFIAISKDFSLPGIKC